MARATKPRNIERLGIVGMVGIQHACRRWLKTMRARCRSDQLSRQQSGRNLVVDPVSDSNLIPFLILPHVLVPAFYGCGPSLTTADGFAHLFSVGFPIGCRRFQSAKLALVVAAVAVLAILVECVERLHNAAGSAPPFGSVGYAFHTCNLPHFQLERKWGKCKPSPSARARELFAEGGFEAVWKEVGAA